SSRSPLRRPKPAFSKRWPPARGLPAPGSLLLGGFRRLAALALLLLLGIMQIDIEAERTHLLDQHVEAFGNARLERVVAAHDGFVDLGAAGNVVRLDGEHFLQGVRGA